jgi:predicted dehydrogenase
MILSLCIAGCGGYARRVLDDIRDMTDQFQFFFASRDLEKAERYSREYGGAGAFGSYEEAAADPRVDALYFFTPHHVHLENLRLAAGHAKHVLMEKPIARSVPEASSMVDVARHAGIKLMVAENYRFLPAVAKAKEIMAQGPGGNAFGELRMIEIRLEGHSEPTGWRRSSEMVGGGVFIDSGIHLVDMMVNLGGLPERVHAIQLPQVFTGVEGEDGLLMTARLPGGAAGLITCSRAAPVRSDIQTVTVTGSGGKLAFAPYGNELTVETREVKRTVRLPAARRGVRGMVSEFHGAIRDDRQPLMSGSEGIKDLAVVLAAYESARTGEAVVVSPPDAA